MSGLNLTWWRKRPIVHVAEPQRINYTQITTLDPDTSQFQTMLMALGHEQRWKYTEKNHGLVIIGRRAFDPKTGRVGDVSPSDYLDPDDWFSEERGFTVTWDGAVDRTKITWLEDEMFPRVTA